MWKKVICGAKDNQDLYNLPGYYGSGPPPLPDEVRPNGVSGADTDKENEIRVGGTVVMAERPPLIASDQHDQHDIPTEFAEGVMINMLSHVHDDDFEDEILDQMINTAVSDSEEDSAKTEPHPPPPPLSVILMTLLLLGVAVFGYIALGTAVFKPLEESAESDRMNTISGKREDLIDKIVNEARGNETLWKSKVTVYLGFFEGELEKFWRKRINSDEESKDKEQKVWTTYGSAVFCASVVTSIGWGNVVPQTDNGRMACIPYAIIGIPMFFSFASQLSELLTRVTAVIARGLFRIIRCCPFVNTSTRSNVNYNKSSNRVPYQNYTPTKVVPAFSNKSANTRHFHHFKQFGGVSLSSTASRIFERNEPPNCETIEDEAVFWKKLLMRKVARQKSMSEIISRIVNNSNNSVKQCYDVPSTLISVDDIPFLAEHLLTLSRDKLEKCMAFAGVDEDFYEDFDDDIIMSTTMTPYHAYTYSFSDDDLVSDVMTTDRINGIDIPFRQNKEINLKTKAIDCDILSPAKQYHQRVIPPVENNDMSLPHRLSDKLRDNNFKYEFSSSTTNVVKSSSPLKDSDRDELVKNTGSRGQGRSRSKRRSKEKYNDLKLKPIREKKKIDFPGVHGGGEGDHFKSNSIIKSHCTSLSEYKYNQDNLERNPLCVEVIASLGDSGSLRPTQTYDAIIRWLSSLDYNYNQTPMKTTNESNDYHHTHGIRNNKLLKDRPSENNYNATQISTWLKSLNSQNNAERSYKPINSPQQQNISPFSKLNDKHKIILSHPIENTAGNDVYAEHKNTINKKLSKNKHSRPETVPFYSPCQGVHSIAQKFETKQNQSTDPFDEQVEEDCPTSSAFQNRIDKNAFVPNIQYLDVHPAVRRTETTHVSPLTQLNKEIVIEDCPRNATVQNKINNNACQSFHDCNHLSSITSNIRVPLSHHNSKSKQPENNINKCGNEHIWAKTRIIHDAEKTSYDELSQNDGRWPDDHIHDNCTTSTTLNLNVHKSRLANNNNAKHKRRSTQNCKSYNNETSLGNRGSGNNQMHQMSATLTFHKPIVQTPGQQNYNVLNIKGTPLSICERKQPQQLSESQTPTVRHDEGRRYRSFRETHSRYRITTLNAYDTTNNANPEHPEHAGHELLMEFPNKEFVDGEHHRERQSVGLQPPPKDNPWSKLMQKRKRADLIEGMMKDAGQSLSVTSSKALKHIQVPFVVYVTLVTFYAVVGMFIYRGLSGSDSLIDSLYFTVIMVTTIGFGDIIPTPDYYISLVLYGFIGLALISFFVNKLIELMLDLIDSVNIMSHHDDVDNDDDDDDGGDDDANSKKRGNKDAANATDIDNDDDLMETENDNDDMQNQGKAE